MLEAGRCCWGFCAGLVFVFLFVFALVIIGILERQGEALGSESFLVFPCIFISEFCKIFSPALYSYIFSSPLVWPPVCRSLIVCYFYFCVYFECFLGGPGAIQGVKLPVALLWQMGKATGAWLWQFALHYVIRQRRQWPCAASGSPYNGPSLCPRRSATGIRCGLRVRESVSESSSSWRWHLLLIASPHVLRTQVPPPRRLNPLSAVAMHHNQRR